MISIRKLIAKHSEDHDDLISGWYWRKKYNTKCIELEEIKEVMASDIYDKVVKNLCDPMENKRLKLQVKRLNRLLEAARDERDYYKDMFKSKKVEIHAKKEKTPKRTNR